MPHYITSPKIKSDGFTLMELMIAVAIVAILAVIALPSYQNQIRKTRRTDAKTALMDLAGREEKIYTTTNAYSNAASDLGYSKFDPVGSGYYKVTVTGAPTGFTITATPKGDQANDTSCASFTVTQAGVRSSLDSSGADSSATCWK
jgi:type IV pilus assembly protein PilE